MRKTAVLALQNRRFDEAIRLLSDLIRQNPQDAESHRLLAIAYAEQGDFASADHAFRTALKLSPNHADYWRDYALCLHRNQRLKSASDAMRKALELRPDRANFYSDLGKVLFAMGELESAVAQLQKGLELEPNNSLLHYETGVILHELKSLQLAAKHLSTALRLQPQNAEAWSHLGGVYFKLAMLEQAEQAFRQELKLKPKSISARSHLGNVLLKRGDGEGALDVYRRALKLDERRPESWFNLGNALSRLHQLSAAEQAFKKCLSLEPQHAEALIELAGVHLAKGQTQSAVQLLQRACTDVGTPTAYSNYFYALHMQDPPDPAGELRAKREFERQHSIPPVGNPSARTRRQGKYRVALLSPDFRKHSVSYFLEPLLEHYDRDQFELICFYTGWQTDAVTTRLQEHVDRWFDAVAWTNEEIAKVIFEQNADCLIDLAGHTGFNRLPVLTARPARVQLTFLGYSGTTGLSSIDYLLTDALANPPASQQHCSERLLYLPATYFCYRPPSQCPEVASLPSEHTEQITFGCFNNRAKLSRRVMDAWAEILRRVPDSRLLLKNTSLIDRNTADSIMAVFRSAGLGEERILLRYPQKDIQDHLAVYNQIDIGLDSFPYNGATTTCEALWMGVPVVSCAGPTHVSRMGLSILSSVSLSQLVACSIEDYIERAVRLAQDRTELRQLRSGMRKRLEASPLMDEVTYTRNFEKVLKKILA